MAVTSTIYYKISNGTLFLRNNSASGYSSWTQSGPNNSPPWTYNNNITTIKIENVITPKYCYHFFYDLKELTSIINITNLHTEECTTMSCMFYNCYSLTSLDVTGFNTSKVTDMNRMFCNCVELTELDLSGFDTSNVTDMSLMFYLADSKDGYVYTPVSKLETLDISSFNTNKVTNMQGMFNGCHKLTEIDVTGFNTSNVTNMHSMFSVCLSLTELDLSGFDTGKVTDMGFMFYRCNALTTLDITSFDTSNVTTMYAMFDSCYVLEFLDVSGFNTSKVINMNSMFDSCKLLKTLDVSGFNTGNVTNMRWMFYNCNSLKTLDVTGFDTSKVTDMSNMFASCNLLTTLDVTGFNISNVTSTYGMFQNCHSLKTLDVTGFNTGNVLDTAQMFYNCQSLTDLDVSGFNTSNVVTMSSMFYNCKSLTDLDVTGFNTSNVTSMHGMFRNCKSLTELDLSTFDISKVTSINYIFGENPQLKIYLPYSASNVLENKNEVFKNITDEYFVYHKITENPVPASVKSFWEGICADYPNVHYQASDNPYPALTSFTSVRVKSSGSTDYYPGTYAYLEATVSIYDDVLPPGWSNAIGDGVLVRDGNVTLHPTWNITQNGNDYIFKTWININDSERHTLALTIQDNISNDNSLVVDHHVSIPLSSVISAIIIAFDAFHKNDLDEISFGAYSELDDLYSNLTDGTAPTFAPGLYYERSENVQTGVVKFTPLNVEPQDWSTAWTDYYYLEHPNGLFKCNMDMIADNAKVTDLYTKLDIDDNADADTDAVSGEDRFIFNAIRRMGLVPTSITNKYLKLKKLFNGLFTTGLTVYKNINTNGTQSSDQWCTPIRVADVNNTNYTFLSGVAKSDGQISSRLYARKVVGGANKDNYIQINVNNDGTLVYSIASPSNFRKAIGLSPVTLNLGNYFAGGRLTGNGGNLGFSIPTGRVFADGTTLTKITFNMVCRVANSNGAGIYIVKKTSGATDLAAIDSSKSCSFYNGANASKSLTTSMWSNRNLQGLTNIYIELYGGDNFFTGNATNTNYANNKPVAVQLSSIVATFNVPD